MSFNLKSFLDIVDQIAPIVLAVTPLAPIAPFVALGVKTAEQIPGATGDQKLALAAQIANVGVQAANAQAGKQVVDPNQVTEAIQAGINTVVAVTNIAQGKNPPAVAPQV